MKKLRLQCVTSAAETLPVHSPGGDAETNSEYAEYTKRYKNWLTVLTNTNKCVILLLHFFNINCVILLYLLSFINTEVIPTVL